MFFWTFGGRYFDDSGNVVVDSDANRQALTLLADLVKEGLILPGNDRFDFRRLFAQEQVAFYPDPPLARAFARAQSGQGEAYDRNVLPVPMPVLKDGDAPVSMQWGHMLGFFDYGGAKPTPDGPSGRFAKLLSAPEVQLEYYKQAGVLPAATAALDALKDDVYLTKWIALSGNARPDETSPFTNASELSNVIGEEIIRGNARPEGACSGPDLHVRPTHEAAGPKK